jgi:hypothetical protein
MSNNVSTGLSVLIDAENAQAEVTAQILSEVAKYGTTTIRRT